MLNYVVTVVVGRGESRLAAFLIIEIAVNDPEAYAQDREAVSRDLAAAGGTHLVRGGVLEVLEGDWRPAWLLSVSIPRTTPGDGGIIRLCRTEGDAAALGKDEQDSRGRSFECIVLTWCFRRSGSTQ
jgi:hypothetical protein